MSTTRRLFLAFVGLLPFVPKVAKATQTEPRTLKVFVLGDDRTFDRIVVDHFMPLNQAVIAGGALMVHPLDAPKRRPDTTWSPKYGAPGANFKAWTYRGEWSPGYQRVEMHFLPMPTLNLRVSDDGKVFRSIA